MGVARVLSAAGENPPRPENWASLEVGPVIAFEEPVALATVKKTAALKDFRLLTHSRLSVAPVTAEHFKLVLKMGKTALPK